MIEFVQHEFIYRRQGYLGNPEATSNAITPDGWFKTGDIAVIDAEGHYSIVDRRKELIKYKVGTLSAPCAAGSELTLGMSYRASKVCLMMGTDGLSC